LAKFQLSGPKASIFQKLPKIAYLLTLANHGPDNKLPIGVHYLFVIHMDCVLTAYGSIDQKSDLCGFGSVCKKFKSLVKTLVVSNVYVLNRPINGLFQMDALSERFLGGQNQTHISNKHQ